MIEYYLDGSVSKLKPLQNQFQLCSNSYRDAERSSRYGVDFNNDCDVDLTKYTSQTFYKTIFYELFLRDTDGTYVKIPVVTYDVTRANNKFNPYDYGTFEFVYRFFMIDNQQSATEIYYAKDFSVNYFLSTESSEKTFLPFIHITYSRLTYSATSTPAQNTVRAHYAVSFRLIRLGQIFSICYKLLFSGWWHSNRYDRHRPYHVGYQDVRLEQKEPPLRG